MGNFGPLDFGKKAKPHPLKISNYWTPSEFWPKSKAMAFAFSPKMAAFGNHVFDQKVRL